MAQILMHIPSASDAVRRTAPQLVKSTSISRSLAEVTRITQAWIVNRVQAELGSELARIAAPTLSSKSVLDRAWFAGVGAQAIGAQQETVVPLGAAVELFYASVVILDDIADGGEVRNGTPCAHLELGVGKAIYLSELLRGVATRALTEWAIAIGTTHTATQLIEAFEEMSIRLNVGQWEDLCSGVHDPDEQTEGEYLSLIRLTTGADIGFCLSSAGIAMGAPTRVREALRSAGERIGCLMQLRDDYLDVSPDGALLEKSVGRDLFAGRVRYPLTLAYSYASAPERALLAQRPIDDQSAASALLTNLALSEPVLSTIRSMAQQLRLAISEDLDGCELNERGVSQLKTIVQHMQI